MTLSNAMLGCAILATSLMGGFFFAFSAGVMRALSRLPAPTGIAAMQSINRAVLNPVFLSVFFGTALLGFVLVVLAVSRWQEAEPVSSPRAGAPTSLASSRSPCCATFR